MLPERVLRRTKALVDFTATDTVYARPLRTVRLKVNRLMFTNNTWELTTLGDPEELCEILRGVFGRLDDHQEHLVLLTLDVSGSVRGYKVLASGSQHSVEIDPAIVYRNALLLGASAIVVAHNHPSDDVSPSPHDINATQLLIRIGNDLNIPLMDHVIVAVEKCVSLRALYPKLF